MPKTCPVCGMDTYSKGEIHPQCAQKQEEDKLATSRKSVKNGGKKAPEKHVPSFILKAWHKWCPKCRTQIHIRKMRCDCGYQF